MIDRKGRGRHQALPPAPCFPPASACLALNSQSMKISELVKGFVARSKGPPFPSSSSTSSKLPHLSWTSSASSCPKNGNLQRAAGRQAGNVAFNSHIIYDALHFDLGCRQTTEPTLLVAGRRGVGRGDRGGGGQLTWLSYELLASDVRTWQQQRSNQVDIKLATRRFPLSLSLSLFDCLSPSASSSASPVDMKICLPQNMRQ